MRIGNVVSLIRAVELFEMFPWTALACAAPLGSRGQQLPFWQAAVEPPLRWTLLTLALIYNKSIRTVPALEKIPIFPKSNIRAQHGTRARYALPTGIHP